MIEPLNSPVPRWSKWFPASLKLRLLLVRRLGLGIGAALLAHGVMNAWSANPHASAVCGAFILGFFGPTVYCEPR
jgi:hypothetical protein